MSGRAAILSALALCLLGCRTQPQAGGMQSLDAEVRQRASVSADGRSLQRDAIQALLSDGLDLRDALRIALVRNAELIAEYEDLNVARADLLQAGLPDNPSFGGVVRFVQNGGGEIIEAALVQPLVSTLLAPNRTSVAQADICAVRARLVASGLRVLGQVRRTWYDLVAAEQIVELHRTATLAARAAHEAAAELRRAGNIIALDAHREQAFYEEQRATLAGAQLTAYAAREMLNEQLGLGGSLTAWSIVKRLPDLPAQAGVPGEIESWAVRRSQDLAHRRALMIALGRRLGLTSVESVVREVSVGAELEREADGQRRIGPSISLEIPIFDYGQAAVPRARALLRQSMLRYVAQGVQVRTQSRIEGETLRSAWRQAKHARDVLMPLRQQVLDETLKQSNAMQVGVFHVLQAQRELISGGEQYVGSLRRYWTSRSRMDQILAGALPGSGPIKGE